MSPFSPYDIFIDELRPSIEVRAYDQLSVTKAARRSLVEICPQCEMFRLAIISADELATQLRYISCRVRRIVIFGDRYLYAYADLRYVPRV